MPQLRVKSIVTTQQSSRQPSRKHQSTSKTASTVPKRSCSSSTSGDQLISPSSQVTITQSTAPAQGVSTPVSSALPNGVLQTFVVWSLALEPLPTTAAQLSNQTLPVWSAVQQPVWPATWNPLTGSYQKASIQPPPQVPWMSTSMTTAQWSQGPQPAGQWSNTNQNQLNPPAQ